MSDEKKQEGQSVVTVGGKRASAAMDHDAAVQEAQKRKKVQESQGGKAPEVSVKQQLNG